MKVTADQFLLDSETKAFDLFHRDTINFNISRYDTSVQQGLSRFFNLENSKKKITEAKKNCSAKSGPTFESFR